MAPPTKEEIVVEDVKTPEKPLPAEVHKPEPIPEVVQKPPTPPAAPKEATPPKSQEKPALVIETQAPIAAPIESKVSSKKSIAEPQKPEAPPQRTAPSLNLDLIKQELAAANNVEEEQNPELQVASPPPVKKPDPAPIVELASPVKVPEPSKSPLLVKKQTTVSKRKGSIKKVMKSREDFSDSEELDQINLMDKSPKSPSK